MKPTAKKEHQKLSRIFANLFYMLGKLWKYSPLYIVGMIIEGVVSGIYASVYVIYTKALFDAIDLNLPFWDIGGPAFVMFCLAAFFLVARLLEAFYWRSWNQYLKNRLYHYLQQELFFKAAKTDLASYDDPKYYNDFIWSLNEAESRVLDISSDVGKMMVDVISLATVFSVALTIDVYISIAILAGAVLTTVVWLHSDKVELAYSMEQKPIQKARDYYDRVFHLPDYAKELRTSKASELLEKQYLDVLDRSLDLNIRYGKKRFLVFGVFDNLIRYIVFYGILAYMTLRLFGYAGGGLLLGSFAASVNLCWQFRWRTYDLCMRIGKLAGHSLFVEKYREFTERRETIVSGDREAEPFRSLKLCNVSFAYEGVKPDETGKTAHTEVLHGISLEIRRGEKIALVGYNGAGKSTLVKLLMRLYDVSDGAIYYNGIDLRELKLDDYRSHIGAVFQDFKLFAASIAENVVGDGYDESMAESVTKALATATFGDRLSELPCGIHTHLTREYDENGMNLSGGEGQKVAIARVFARPYELIIMDEPSAALDPLAEASLNKAILEYAREHTIIFISHRLSTTKIADKIYMMDGGRIVEEGSHEELMAQEGKYAEMFARQAEKYAEGQTACD